MENGVGEGSSSRFLAHREAAGGGPDRRSASEVRFNGGEHLEEYVSRWLLAVIMIESLRVVYGVIAGRAVDP